MKKPYNPKYQDAGRRTDKDPIYRFYVSPATIERTRDALLDEVVIKRRFLEPGLRASEVGKAIGVTSKTMAATMTTCFHTCFRDWVNTYRVEYAMTILRDKRKKDLLIEEIRALSGFATTQAFYKAFYRHTGITPIQYRKTEI